MSESLTEYLAIRCTPSMKESLDKLVSKGVSRNVADHVRFALELYIDGTLNAFDSDEVERVKTEMEKAFGVNVTTGELVVRLIKHWDLTKRDSYGFQRFA